MTTANKVTIVRILLVPFFVSQGVYYVGTGHEYHRLLALLAFGVAALTDAVDGYIAKRYNQRSELGAILDPLADKLLLVSGIVLLSFENHGYFAQIPLWLTTLIISRDLLLLIGLIVIQYAAGKVHVRPHIIGKMATVFQIGAVLWILLKWDNEWLPIWIIGAGFCTGASAAIYIFDGIRQMSGSPRSSATPPER